MLVAPALVAFGFTGTAIVTGGCLGNAAPPKPPTAQVIRAARESNDSKGGDESREFAPMTQATAERDSLTHQKAVALVNAVLKVFSGASIKMEVRTDPDEGWSRTVLFVRTGIHDFDLRMDAEDQFYALVDLDENLRDALHSTVISFS